MYLSGIAKAGGQQAKVSRACFCQPELSVKVVEHQELGGPGNVPFGVFDRKLDIVEHADQPVDPVRSVGPKGFDIIVGGKVVEMALDHLGEVPGWWRDRTGGLVSLRGPQLIGRNRRL